MQMYQLVPSKDAEAGVQNGRYKSKWAHNDGDERLDDLVHMTFLEYPNILHTLRERTKTTPYTRIGPRSVLISVNPYKLFKGIYDEEKIDEYHDAQQTFKLEPHIFAIASDAYRALKDTDRSQSILTSGESGSGKTENSKMIFKFLARVAGGNDKETGSAELQRTLVDSNYVLEAFGNAKTLRNDNSSRFGKLVQIHFDKDGRLSGSTMNTYLLEQPRVSSPPKGERNYHIFYQLLRGMSDGEMGRRGMEGGDREQLVQRWRLVSSSGCTLITDDGTPKGKVTVDDKKEWRDMENAMDALQFTDQQKQEVFDVLAAVLHLSAAEFGKDTPDETSHRVHKAFFDQVSIDGKGPLRLAARLLGVERPWPQDGSSAAGGGFDAFQESFLSQKVANSRQDFPREKAEQHMDAVVQMLFAHLFDWLVAQIAKATSRGMGRLYIGVLDIFGFEIFETNSLEQLCINFANERLQRNFTETVFRKEQEEYAAEGIQLPRVPFEANAAVISIIWNGQSPSDSVLGIIRDVVSCRESSTPTEATEKKILAEMRDNEVFKKTTNEAGRNIFNVAGTAQVKLTKVQSMSFAAEAEGGKQPTRFTLMHYAGDVEYSVQDFCDKSISTVSRDLIALLKEYSSSNVVRSMFEIAEKRGPASKHIPGRASMRGGPASKPTVGTTFASDLDDLIEGKIEKTDSHFVRCIKPNSTKARAGDKYAAVGLKALTSR